GGSLGAFGCGVFKALAERNVNIDIVGGTSIGGVNAAIIAGNKDGRPEAALEEFWMDLAENSVDLESLWSSSLGNNGQRGYPGPYFEKANMSLKHALTFYSSAAFGNNKMFLPRWMPEY